MYVCVFIYTYTYTYIYIQTRFKKVGTLYKLWIKTECNDVEVSNFNIYSEYNIDDISNV